MYSRSAEQSAGFLHKYGVTSGSILQLWPVNSSVKRGIYAINMLIFNHLQLFGHLLVQVATFTDGPQKPQPHQQAQCTARKSQK